MTNPIATNNQAGDIIYKALEALQDRAACRDKPNGERSMARAVKIFNAMTDADLTETEGWKFMIALKLSRTEQGTFVMDDYIDLAGYAGLAGESHQNEASV